MIIINFIKEWRESRVAKKKIRVIYGGPPPTHKGCEDVKNGISVLDRYKQPPEIEYHWPAGVQTEKKQ